MKDEKLLEYEAPRYEPPKVITLDKDEILEEMGPARACQYYDSASPCSTFGG
jgi:hypothetical protein